LHPLLVEYESLPLDYNQIIQIIQIHNVYIATASIHGIVLIDQHAAHERILFEKFQNAFIKEKEKADPFQLTKPILIELSAYEAEILHESLLSLEDIGFRLNPFHKTTWNITHVPSVFKDRDIKNLLIEYIRTSNQGIPYSIDAESKKMLAFLSCKSAVKAGDPLTFEQMKDILLELEKIPHAVTCPHGRPVKWDISVTELHKLFKRS
jgi:DNA mismatch repair protein MutL